MVFFLDQFSAFKISQSSDNETYLAKLEKDIQEKVNSIAAIAEGVPQNQTDTDIKGHKHKGKRVNKIEIHTETDEPPANETEIEKEPVDKFTEVDDEERTQRVEVLDPVIKETQVTGKTSTDETKLTEIDKDIVITGKPKLRGNVFIDTTVHYKHLPKPTNKGSYVHTENITGFNIDDFKTMKSHPNATSGHTAAQTTGHAQRHKAYHDYEVAHKVLSKNIEKLKHVLKAIEDAPVNNGIKEQGTEMVKKNEDNLGKKQRSNDSVVTTVLKVTGTPLVNNIISYLPPTGYKDLKTQSSTDTTVTKLPGPPAAQQIPPNNIPLMNTSQVKNTVGKENSLQDTSTNQSQLAHTNGVLLGAQPVSNTTAPGLHVIQGNGNRPNVDSSAQASADVVDHIANELVQHRVASQANTDSTSQRVNKLNHHNKSLRETFKELKPDDSKICKFDCL